MVIVTESEMPGCSRSSPFVERGWSTQLSKKWPSLCMKQYVGQKGLGIYPDYLQAVLGVICF